MKNKTLPLGPGVPEEFVVKFGQHAKAALCGWDRLLLRGTLRPLFSPARAWGYLCASKILLKNFDAYAQTRTGRAKDAAVAAALAAGRPYHFLRSSSTNKLALARTIATRDQLYDGLITVFSAIEPCLAVSVRGDRESGRLATELPQRRWLHLYHYLQHPIFACAMAGADLAAVPRRGLTQRSRVAARPMDRAGLADVPMTSRVPESILQTLRADVWVSESIAANIETRWDKGYWGSGGA